MATTPVCVTGASGFIAAHVVRELLARGDQVRGTVRNPASTASDFLTALPGAEQRLELVAADLLSPGSFDRAVAGCDAVVHTASPYAIDVSDPQRDLVDPAVNGTLNVLRAAAAAGVKRVVLTSSMAAVSDEPVKGKIFTEKDWNERSTLERNPYYLSKMLAERAAWEFAGRSKSFELVVINPFMVIGPSLGPGLNTSNAILRDILRGVFPGIIGLSWGFVDVRDVAHAHVLAMEVPKASGRYLCASETLSMGEIVALLKESGYGTAFKLPRLNLASPFGNFVVRLLSYTRPRGTGSYLRTHVGKVMMYDNSRIRRDLGVEFRNVRETILTTVEDLVRWGHVRPIS
jgi:dihydroflavonol-4-reductase